MSNKKSSNNMQAQWFTRFVFAVRLPLVIVLAAVTVFLGTQALKLEFRPGFEKMIPTEHPYIQNFFKHKEIVQGANFIQIAVAVEEGTIFDANYLATLQKISDDVFLLPGVDRSSMKSLWTKNVQWIAVTADGFDGDVVIQDSYDGSVEAIEQVRANVLRSGQVGKLVANNFKSSIIHVPLLETNPETNEQLDYWKFSKHLDAVLAPYEQQGVNIHVIGFAKLIGDLLDGMTTVVGFFGIACVISFVLVYFFSRCIQGAMLPVVCSLIAVVWQLGALQALGYGLDPFNILVPFLVFAIGISHGVQMLNAVGVHQCAGLSARDATMTAFGSVFGAGISAIVSDAFGFLTLVLIPIQVIQELGLAASIGVLALIGTNLLLMPALVSFLGLTKSGITHAARKEQVGPGGPVSVMSQLVRRRPAIITILVAAALAAGGLYIGQDQRIGDLDRGSPELRPEAEYNQDVAYVVENYSTSTDVMILMVEVDGDYQCVSYDTLDTLDQLQWHIGGADGVQSTTSAADAVKRLAVFLNEGNYRWRAIPREQGAIFSNLYGVPDGQFYNNQCDLSLVYITLNDHKAETLDNVIAEVEAFSVGLGPDAGLKILLAAGNAGIAAATNQEIERSQIIMLIAVYLAVTLIVFLTFRSVPAVICILAPLVLTSILAQAVMVFLGIGVKVATLPVIALGVGIGVDYGIYIFNRLSDFLKDGLPIREAYLQTLKGTGRAVVFTALALAIGACTWIFSPIKFQADMGALLTFMFLWNMIGALTLSPALAYFLIHGRKASVASMYPDREEPREKVRLKS